MKNLFSNQILECQPVYLKNSFEDLKQIYFLDSFKIKPKVIDKSSFCPRYSKEQLRRIKRLTIDNKKRIQYHKKEFIAISKEEKKLTYNIQRNFNQYSLFIDDEKIEKIYSRELILTNAVLAIDITGIFISQKVRKDGSN